MLIEKHVFCIVVLLPLMNIESDSRRLYPVSTPHVEQFTADGVHELNQQKKNCTIERDSFCVFPPRSNNTDPLPVPDAFDTNDPTTQAALELHKDLFSSACGPILYYALLVAEERIDLELSHVWDGKNWPDLPKWEDSNGTSVYQATPVWWNPFNGTEHNIASFILGENTCDETHYCNAALRPDTKYALKVLGFTSCEYQDTEIIYFMTLQILPVVEIALTLISIMIVTVVAIILTLMNREFLYRLEALSGLKAKSSTSPLPQPLSHKNFLKYSEDLLKTEGRLSSEFHLLGTLSTDVSTPSLHGQRIDNKSKNRYMNVLPFDVTRVKLSIVNDDPCSDYVNASFMKGYSHEIEYIATQGPKEETSHDFWRMVMEQNVEFIVMLTQLEEHGKEKCFKYYPEYKEALTFKNIKVTCTSCENEEVCVVRTLMVSVGSKHMAVTHFHFKEWADFGCPTTEGAMLQLCNLIQENPRIGYILVHCSAGIGRTGTLIAIDILLQEIKNNHKIDVFGTILQLRQQRMNMVQTEAQYEYIYKCVAAAIVNMQSHRQSIINYN